MSLFFSLGFRVKLGLSDWYITEYVPGPGESVVGSFNLASKFDVLILLPLEADMSKGLYWPGGGAAESIVNFILSPKPNEVVLLLRLCGMS